MAVGTTTALLMAGGAFSAATSIAGSNNQAKAIEQQGEYNALVYEQQAQVIDQQREVSAYQHTRLRGRYRGSIVAGAGGRGLKLSGSPLAVLADTESELLFDQAIDDYNLQINKNYALSGAASYRADAANRARSTRFSGYANAFSTLLGVGAGVAGQGGFGGGKTFANVAPLRAAGGATRVPVAPAGYWRGV